MKKLLLGVLILSGLLSCAPFSSTKPKGKPNEVSYNELKYQQVVKVPGMTSPQIIRKVNRWAIDNYNSYKTVFQFSDTSSFALNSKTTIQIQYKYKSGNKLTDAKDIDYHLRVDAKLGSCRILLNGYDEFSRETEISKANSIAKGNERDIKLYEIKAKYDELDKHAEKLINSLSGFLKSDVDEW